MSKELKELHDRLNYEIETEDASDEVLDMCQAAREAHDAAFIDWQKSHPAEWAAVLKKADEATAAYDSPF